MVELAIVDAHCHLDRLDLQNYHGDLDLALQVAEKQAVYYILCPSINLEHYPNVLAIAKRYPHVWATVGVHPTEENARNPSIEELCELAKDPLVVGIGETGLDYARCQENIAEQKRQQELFIKHIKAAKIVNKPLIVHSRMAAADILQILRETKAYEVGGMLHCFVEDLPTAIDAMQMNFYISFSGIITFKNAEKLRQIAGVLPLDKVLLETDAPYLTPVPMRGKPNEPAYLRYIAEYFAHLRGLTLEEVAKTTTDNFFRLFRIT